MLEETGIDEKSAARGRLKAARRIVVKLGTSVVTGAGGQVSAGHLEPLVAAVIELKRAGRQVVLVSSGAVGKRNSSTGRMIIDVRESEPASLDKVKITPIHKKSGP